MFLVEVDRFFVLAIRPIFIDGQPVEIVREVVMSIVILVVETNRLLEDLDRRFMIQALLGENPPQRVELLSEEGCELLCRGRPSRTRRMMESFQHIPHRTGWGPLSRSRSFGEVIRELLVRRLAEGPCLPAHLPGQPPQYIVHLDATVARLQKTVVKDGLGARFQLIDSEVPQQFRIHRSAEEC